MLGKPPIQNQQDLFKPLLSEFIDLQHELILLGNEIQWQVIENQFSSYYSHTGTPSKPVRLMVGLMILKQMYDLSDEGLIASWIQNPYFQYFCGMSHFQWKQPCDPSDLVHFRNRIGKTGAEQILKLSLGGHQSELEQCKAVNVDTTVQEKNITFPTDVKLYVKIMDKCRQLAQANNIELRQSYIRVEKGLLLKLRFSHHPRRKKEARKAFKKLKTTTGRLLRDMERKLPDNLLNQLKDQIARWHQVLLQKRHQQNKVYSIHEPDVWCIAKGKSHKPYEFGSKTSVSTLPGSNLVVGVLSFKGNPYDGDTMAPALEQIDELLNKQFTEAIADRGYRGRKYWKDTEIITPGQKRPQDPAGKRKIRKLCSGRSAIEPIIGHMKSDHRMGRNFLKGFKGDQINAILAGAAFNFKAWIRKIQNLLDFLLNSFLQKLIFLTFNLQKTGC
jgi:IS5 family transposase